MLYTSSKDALKKTLVGIGREFQACDYGDLEWSDILATLIRMEAAHWTLLSSNELGAFERARHRPYASLDSTSSACLYLRLYRTYSMAFIWFLPSFVAMSQRCKFCLCVCVCVWYLLYDDWPHYKQWCWDCSNLQRLSQPLKVSKDLKSAVIKLSACQVIYEWQYSPVWITVIGP